MPVSENVEDFIAKIGPMYAVVDPSGQSLEANGEIRKVMIANGSIDHNANGHMDYDKMISNMTNGGEHVVLRDSKLMRIILSVPILIQKMGKRRNSRRN